MMKQASIKRSIGRNAQPRRGGMFIVMESETGLSPVGAAWNRKCRPAGAGCSSAFDSYKHSAPLELGFLAWCSPFRVLFFLVALLLVPRALSAADAEAEQLKSRAYEL